MMRLSEAAHAVSGEFRGADATFTGVSTDTRQVRAGDLFVALKGERFDAHDFVGEAANKGAAGALVSHWVDAALSQVKVPDTKLALGQLGAAWRARFAIPVLAVTGSNGKTTVKEMLASIMSQSGRGIATQGNLNNDIGVPLTLLRLRAEDRYAVIEMGANHVNEIAYLTGLARPSVAVINNVAPAHLEGFGSLADVVRAKCEIYQGLGADGVAVVNADDPNVENFKRSAAPHRIVTFGMQATADVSALEDSVQYRFSGLNCETVFQLRIGTQSAEVRLALMGRHNVMNALAGAAVASAAGVSFATICAGLNAMRAVGGRLQMKSGIHGVRVIDDTYNANPGSCKVAVDVLAAAPGTRIFVLGDMAELGRDAEDLHRQVGVWAKAAGIDALYAAGPLSRAAVDVFGPTGWHFSERQALIAALRDDVQAGRFADAVILVKGSRSSRMEEVVAALVSGGTAGSAGSGAAATTHAPAVHAG